jgi:hypothetical protein
MPIIVRASATSGHAPEKTYCLATTTLDHVLNGAPLALVLDAGLLRQMAGTSNISATVLSLLQQLEAEIAAGRVG